MMRVSVALATYNGQKYLIEQLDSLASQTLLPAELVVSDDGSTDGTVGIIHEFAKRAPFPVRLLDKDRNLGFADNFLFAASNCECELIAFCDQDDVWLPKKLEMERQRIVADESLLAMHTHILTDESLKETGRWTQGIERDDVVQPLIQDPVRGGWGNCMMFRSELIRDIPYDQRPRQPEEPGKPLAHDTWIYVLAAALGTISRIAEPLILYRQHGANVYGAKPRSFRERLQMRLHFDMSRIKERAEYYDALRIAFERLARDASSPFKSQAAKAALLYAQRYIPLKLRIDIYEKPGLSGRLAAFKHMYLSRSLTPHDVANKIVRGNPVPSESGGNPPKYLSIPNDDGVPEVWELTDGMAMAMNRGSRKSIAKDLLLGVFLGSHLVRRMVAGGGLSH